MLKRKTKLILIAVLAVLAVAAGIIYFMSGKDETVTYETAIIDHGNIIAKVTATGTLSALVTVQVGSQVSGRIQELLVDFNSPVDEGQVLARIDPQLFAAARDLSRANVASSQGALAKAKAQAADAQLQYERQKLLAEKNLIAQQDLDTSKANADAAKAQVDADAGMLSVAQAALRQAEVNLGYTTIISPIKGVVISRNVDVGQTVAASLQAPTLFTIAEDLGRMQVDTNVAEADVGKLSPQMKAIFTVDAYPNEKFTGVVRQIRNAPQVLQNVVTYDAVIDVDNPDLKLKPGMTANATFIYAQADDVLRIPNAALRFRPSPDLLATANGDSKKTGAGGRHPPSLQGNGAAKPNGDQATDQRSIWVLIDGKPVAKNIRIAISDGSFTQIIGGDLHEKDLVITDMSGNTGGNAPSGFGLMPRPPGGGGMRRMF